VEKKWTRADKRKIRERTSRRNRFAVSSDVRNERGKREPVLFRFNKGGKGEERGGVKDVTKEVSIESSLGARLTTGQAKGKI